MSLTLTQANPLGSLRAPTFHANKIFTMLIICNSGASYVMFNILKHI